MQSPPSSRPRRRFSMAALALVLLSAPLHGQQISPAGAAPLAWAECQPGQIEVMILGTFHFAQSDAIDILEPGRQRELDTILGGLEAWAPDRIAVEYPYAERDTLRMRYDAYLGRDAGDPSSRNEISQVGFRLGRRLGHDEVYGIDVPMNLWDDSIQVFDDRWPRSRGGLRARWPARYADAPRDAAGATLAETLRRLNRDEAPGNSEMYGGFLPLVEEDVYAGALKLRPWYDRNLRIVQNLFRIADPADHRILLVIGAGHLRVLKQILEVTPQMCPVSAIPYLGS